MWNGTHTKACNLNGYESVMCLTVFAFPGLYVGFPVLWVLCYNYLVARIGFIRIPCFMIILSYLFISALTYLTPEYFLLDIICYMHICAHPASPLMFYSSNLLYLSYHTMSIPCLISFVVYLLAPACLCPRHGYLMHVYDSDLSIHVCLSMLAIWLPHHHSPWSSDSSGSSCPGFGAWSVWILPVADQSGAAVAWISCSPSRAPSFQALLFGSWVFLLWLWAPFVLFILVPSLVFSQLRHIGDVIFL